LSVGQQQRSSDSLHRVESSTRPRAGTGKNERNVGKVNTSRSKNNQDPVDIITLASVFCNLLPESILSPGQGLRTRAKRTTGKQGLRYTPRPEAPHYYPALVLSLRDTMDAGGGGGFFRTTKKPSAAPRPRTSSGTRRRSTGRYQVSHALESILSPGQGWHRRANAQKCYKSPPNGQPIN
jgi:hypothetical protein